jgi:flagellar biogenesis protein FliO
MGKDRQRGNYPGPFQARIGGLIFALAVVVAAIWLLSRVQ